MEIYKGRRIGIENKEYKLVKQIGQGGAGVVWLSECDGIEYAIKFLADTVSESKQNRFFREIKFCKECTHENIVKIIAEAKYENYYCYVMQYYSKTFRNIIEDSTITYMKKLEYIEKLCKAIKYAHEENVIHRDIKPENILIENDNLVLADFGIAHFKDSTLTKKNDLMANRNYTPPELRIRNNANNITYSADIFSLGKVINECFTQQNVSGTHFKTITDVVPMLSPLDKLVDRMIRQNPEQRPNIHEIFSELKLQRGQTLDLIEVIENNNEPDFDIEIEEVVLKKIMSRACEDILIAKYIFENIPIHEYGKYNHNYRMKIHYQVDDYLSSLYFQELLYDVCLRKFRYESNVYKDGSMYSPLDLKSSEEHIKIYEKFRNLVKQYSNLQSDISGEILKLFSSCCDYHCKEILDFIEVRILKQLKELNNAPILYIIILLKEGIKTYRDEVKLINIEEHILINWKRTKSFESNIDDLDLIKVDINQPKEKILSSFHNKWDAVISEVENDYYSVKFMSTDEFNRFKDYALELSRPYYIFEEDVLDLIKVKREYEDIIELKLLNSFDIENTLAKILGIRTDY